MTNKNFKLLNAFTLAEVLITLGIIGVVAAVTMPTLIKNYQKKETVTKLKRAYAEVQQVIKMSEAEHGEMSGWGVPSSAEDLERQQFVDEYIVKYFKPIKKCVPASDECFKHPLGLNGADFMAYPYPEKDIAFITQSGMSYIVWIHGSNNGGWIYVDLDGPNRGKNIVGKDIFSFIMQFDKMFEVNGDPSNVVSEKVGVFPLGLSLKRKLSRDELISVDSEYAGLNRYKCSKENFGLLCGALIITDGWEIRDDYPW